ncbi:hypothetical protein [Actinomadura macrotermitis]|uniref:Uncharacterized protein n=1 Tax=Actinomadura macrotermitis TaxID=2585200 RepID=A0A7K0BQI8_9ACTN|nr:hypothetical protein [Actinomadura macrotermitis]MQY03296.1 hypothetical protein [Actinomadura macrotermitis]
MNDLDILHDAWEAPAPPSRAAHDAARAALLARAAGTAALAPAPARRRRRLGLRVAVVGAVAAAAVAGVTVVQTGGSDGHGRPRPVIPGIPPGPVANAAEALDRAALAAQGTAARPEQWIYTEVTDRYPGTAHKARVERPTDGLRTRVVRSWWRADGKEAAEEDAGRLTTRPLSDPVPADVTDGRTMLHWAYGQVPGGREDERDPVVQGEVFGRLNAMVREHEVPARRLSLVFKAIALIPGVKLVPGRVDALGHPAIAVGRVTEGWLREEVLLDARTYAYVGERSIAIKDHTSTGMDGTSTVKKGTIQLIAARTKVAVVDRPGQRP